MEILHKSLPIIFQTHNLMKDTAVSKALFIHIYMHMIWQTDQD